MDAEAAQRIEALLQQAQQHAAQQDARAAQQDQEIQRLGALAASAERRAQALEVAEAARRAVPAQEPPAPPRPAGEATNKVIDTRVLGKPESFSGEPGTWRDWSTVFRAYASACDPRMQQAMERAEASEDPVLNAVIPDE